MKAPGFLVVLLVDDDRGDQKLARRALTAQGGNIVVHVAASAEEALTYLHRCQSDEAQYPPPHLVLLDLNMPGMGGKEFLKSVKNCRRLCDIPVFVLTSSDSEIDIQECYGLGAAGYIRKPATPENLKKVATKATEQLLETSTRANEADRDLGIL
jgi:CheY-like chemotaxis protein